MTRRGRAIERNHLIEEGRDVTAVRLCELRPAPPEEGFDELVRTHANQAVEPCHRHGRAAVAARSPPCDGVEIGVVNEGAVHIEHDGRTRSLHVPL